MNSSCIFFAELLKFVTSVILLGKETNGIGEALKLLTERFVTDYLQTLKVCVPALAYVIQNSLIFFSLDKISGAVQQVTYQLKILTAAVLGVIMLGKHLKGSQWFSLVLLVCGVALVQYPRGNGSASANGGEGSKSSDSATGTSDAVLGFTAVLAACVVSGFAGAYMEKLLKGDDSIWLRNAQLAFFGSFIGLFSAFVQDGETLANDGITVGFTRRTVGIVLALGSGGLLVAVVLKYADNIARQFSTALSIILTSIMSWLFFEEYQPDALFACGTALAITATFVYSLGLPCTCLPCT